MLFRFLSFPFILIFRILEILLGIFGAILKLVIKLIELLIRGLVWLAKWPILLIMRIFTLFFVALRYSGMFLIRIIERVLGVNVRFFVGVARILHAGLRAIGKMFLSGLRLLFKALGLSDDAALLVASPFIKIYKAIGKRVEEL